MREIKFRGHNETFKWRYGSLKYTRFDNKPIIYDDGYPYEVDPETVGQYTGLKDVHGKEIYEGDIVKQSACMIGGCDITGEVKYDEGCYWIDDGEKALPLFNETSVNVVIGNKYDNPELLKLLELRS